MMTFIIELIRNLLQYRVDDTYQDDLHSHFLVTLLKEDMMGPLLYMIQMEKGELLSRI